MTKPVTRKMAVDCLLYIADEMLDVPFTCYICKDWILAGDPVQFDHIHAIVHNGPHEYKNLRPVHAECHKIKTKADVQANCKVKRILANKPSRRPMKSGGRKMQSRPFQKRPDGKPSTDN